MTFIRSITLERGSCLVDTGTKQAAETDPSLKVDGVLDDNVGLNLSALSCLEKLKEKPRSS